MYRFNCFANEIHHIYGGTTIGMGGGGGGGGGGVRGIQTGRSYSEDITNYNSLKVCFTTMTGIL